MALNAELHFALGPKSVEYVSELLAVRELFNDLSRDAVVWIEAVLLAKLFPLLYGDIVLTHLSSLQL
jgi:hypothetical protein